MVEMTEVAEHINAMKKKYDTAVHVQEIQSLMRGHEVCTHTHIYIHTHSHEVRYTHTHIYYVWCHNDVIMM